MLKPCVERPRYQLLLRRWTPGPFIGSVDCGPVLRWGGVRLVFVIAPGVALQPTCGKDRGPFVQALRKGLGGFLSKHDIEEGGFF